MLIIKHRIIKYITDRPGQVVYRADIMEDGGFTANQVSSAILRTQQDSPIGGEIQTIVPGNAWRYVPNSSTSTGRTGGADLSRPLVKLLREYFEQRPGQVIGVEELVEATGRTEAQVKVGMNNARSNHLGFRTNLEVIVSGNMWRYGIPTSTATDAPTAPVASPPVTSARPPASPVAIEPVTAPIRSTNATDGSARLFEEVGTTGDGSQVFIIRDGDGVLYRATPLT